MIGTLLDALRRDLRDAVRSLRRTPVFTISAILILGLGIGMATAMFTVFEQVVVRRLPVQDQDLLIELSGMGKGAASEIGLLASEVVRFREQQHTLAGVAGYAHWGAVQNTIVDGERRYQLRISAVTGNFFDVLGVTPAFGHLFSPADDPSFSPTMNSENRNPAAAVLTYDTWKREFAGDSSVIGRRLRVLEFKWAPVVMGIAPPGLDYPRGVQFWISNSTSTIDLVGRLAPGATLAAAKADYQAFVRHNPEYVKAGVAGDVGTRAVPVVDMVLGDLRPALIALITAVGILLLLACINVGNLLLLRLAGRAREIAVRRAIGATSGEIVAHLASETVVLGLVGGALGLVFAKGLIAALVTLAPATLPRLDVVRFAPAPVLIATATSMVAMILFGLFAVGAARDRNPANQLRSDSRSGTETRRSGSFRRGLVATQLAFALVLLAGATLVTRTFARLAGLDLGFRVGQVAVLGMTMPWEKWVAPCGGSPLPTDSIHLKQVNDCVYRSMVDFHTRVMDELHLIPAVEKVSPVSVPPFLGTNVFMTRISAEGQSAAEASANPFVGQEYVGTEYFDVMGLPILSGRGFVDTDRMGTLDVAIVSQGVAKLLWPGKNPIGKRMMQAPGLPLWTVVGLVPDIHFREHRHATPMVFRPYQQTFAQGTLVARIRGGLSPLAPALRRAVHAVDPDAELTNAETMDGIVAPQLSQPRLNALLFGAFALAAIVLAAIGLYGIMSSTVVQQRRELGVRMALGATSGQLQQMIFRQACVIAGAGALCGLLGALAGSRLLSSMLFEVSPTDPVTLIGVSLLLLAVALFAAYLPARRATRIDPAIALRSE